MADKQYDVIIVGGGPGGYIAGIRAGQLGLKTLVVEKDKLGGICLNWGCIPTKALLKNAEVYNLLRHAGDFGFSFDNLKADFSVAVKRSRDIAARSSKGIEFLFKKNKITWVKGSGKLAGKSGGSHRLLVTSPEGEAVDRDHPLQSGHGRALHPGDLICVAAVPAARAADGASPASLANAPGAGAGEKID